MGLSCAFYGGFVACCGCDANPMGIYGLAVAAVWDLWDLSIDPMGIYGLLWLRCGTYGGSMGCCGCSVGPMEDLWAAVAAVWDLWH